MRALALICFILSGCQVTNQGSFSAPHLQRNQYLHEASAACASAVAAVAKANPNVAPKRWQSVYWRCLYDHKVAL
ncbi:hypothetical protein D3C85_1804480 [compost metagenome]